MSAEPFTWEWVCKKLTRPRRGDKRPDAAGCDRIAAAFNHVYVQENFAPIWDSPVPFWASRASRSTALVHPFPAPRRRWPGLVFDMGKVVCDELNAANPGRKPPFAYTTTGPVVKILVEAIPIITRERPTAEAVAMEFRQAPNLMHVK